MEPPRLRRAEQLAGGARSGEVVPVERPVIPTREATVDAAIGAGVGSARVEAGVGRAAVGAGVGGAAVSASRGGTERRQIEVVEPDSSRGRRHPGDAGTGQRRRAAVGDGEARGAVHRGGQRHGRRSGRGERQRCPIAQVRNAAGHVAEHGGSAATPAPDLQPARAGDRQVVPVRGSRRVAAQGERRLGAESHDTRVDAAIGAEDALDVCLIENGAVRIGSRVRDECAGGDGPVRTQPRRIVAVEVVEEEHGARGRAAIAGPSIRTCVHARVAARIGDASVAACIGHAGIAARVGGAAIRGSPSASRSGGGQFEVVEPDARAARRQPRAARARDGLRAHIGHAQPVGPVHRRGDRDRPGALRREGEGSPVSEVGNTTRRVAEDRCGAGPPAADLDATAREHDEIVPIARRRFAQGEAVLGRAESDETRVDPAIGARHAARHRAIQLVATGVRSRIGDPEAGENGPVRAKARCVVPIEVVREQDRARSRPASASRVRACVGASAVRAAAGTGVRAGIGSGATCICSRVGSDPTGIDAGVRCASVRSTASKGGQGEIVEPDAGIPRRQAGCARRSERLRRDVRDRQFRGPVHRGGERHGARALRRERERSPVAQVGDAAWHIAQDGHRAASPAADLHMAVGEENQLVTVAGRRLAQGKAVL